MLSILLNITRIGNSKFKCNYLKNENLFLNFLFDFRNLHQISNILKQKMMVIANVFSDLQTVKILVRSLSKKRRFRKRFHRQHVKVSQILAKSPWQPIYQVFYVILGEVGLENVSLSFTRNLRCFCWHIACRCLVYCWILREFEVPNWNAIIWKKKTFFWIFCSISAIYIKFQTSWRKKRWS